MRDGRPDPVTWVTIREVALGVHRRCSPVIDLLYSTGARLQEACGVTLEDVKDTHIILRDTKRRPGGLQVHRAVPLGPVSRAAVYELGNLPPGKRNTLIVGVSRAGSHPRR